MKLYRAKIQPIAHAVIDSLSASEVLEVAPRIDQKLNSTLLQSWKSTRAATLRFVMQ